MEKTVSYIVRWAALGLALLTLAACNTSRASITGSGHGDSGQTDFENAENVKNSGIKNPGDSVTNSQNNSDNSEETLTYVHGSGHSLMIPSSWNTEYGAYYAAAADDISRDFDAPIAGGGRGGWSSSIDVSDANDVTPPLLVYITDKSTGKDIVLCNKPNCVHDSDSCGAVVPYDENPDESSRRPGYNRFMPAFLFADDDYIYVFNKGRTFFRLNFDGSNRTEHIKIPDEYHVSGTNWLMNGKLYMNVWISIPTGEYSSSSIAALIEVDYTAKSVREVWRADIHTKSGMSFDEVYRADILGLWDGRVFIHEVFYPPLVRTQQGITYYQDNQEIKIISLDPATGNKEDVHSDKSDGFSVNYFTPQFYYHSRREEAVFRFDLLTGTAEKIGGGISGYINIQSEIDGRLFMYRDNTMDDIFNKNYQLTGNDLFFLDLSTGEITESRFELKRNIGETTHCTIIKEEDGYFYLIVEEELAERESAWAGRDSFYETVRQRTGRVKKQDYWNNNTAAIELFEWEDVNNDITIN